MHKKQQKSDSNTKTLVMDWAQAWQAGILTSYWLTLDLIMDTACKQCMHPVHPFHNLIVH